MEKITLFIILVNVVMSFYGFEHRLFFDRYKFQVGPIEQKDYIRLISSGFLHVDLTHLLFNMMTLYFFAHGVLSFFGIYVFLGIYIGSLLAGNILSFFMHRNDFFYAAVGASGAVSGVLFSYILLYPTNSLYLMFIPIPIPAIVVGVGYLLYSMFGMKKQWGNIGHAAHIGGAAMGLIISVLIEPNLLLERFYVLIALTVPLVFIVIFRNKLEK